MRHYAPIRFIAATILSTAALSHAQPQAASNPVVPAQSALPATTPPTTPAQSPPQRAKITYTDNMIAVTASNSSLNQILRDISRLTGIKITGGVADERVFGSYGPSSPPQVLAALLDGTGSNMLIVDRTGDAPTELILTPRQGGPTPPNPNAQSFNNSSDSDESSEEVPSNPVARPIRHQPPSPYAPHPIPSPDSSSQTSETPAQTSVGEGTSQPSSSNGIRTPQQIYDELQRLRQQQSKPQE